PAPLLRVGLPRDPERTGCSETAPRPTQNIERRGRGLLRHMIRLDNASAGCEGRQVPGCGRCGSADPHMRTGSDLRRAPRVSRVPSAAPAPAPETTSTLPTIPSRPETATA